MTLEQIKARRHELEEKIADHQTEIDVARAELKANQCRCKHPNKFNTCCMGDSGVYCPDCGYAT